jgi:hypothetical protein
MTLYYDEEPEPEPVHARLAHALNLYTAALFFGQLMHFLGILQ